MKPLFNVVDFGMAKQSGPSQHLKTICGTPQYFAPEVAQSAIGTSSNIGYTVAADIWSVGVILYVLLRLVFNLLLFYMY